MKHHPIALVLMAFYLTASAAQPLAWNAQNKMAGWHAMANVRVQNTGERLILTDIRHDSQVISPLMDLEPQAYNRFSYRYRAQHTGKGGGQLFFAHRPGQFTDRNCWIIPPMIPDGKWHTTTLSLKTIRNLDAWLFQGNIVQLRLDPIDAPGGTIELTDIRLYHEQDSIANRPLPKPTFILDAPPWPKAKTQFLDKQACVDGQPYFRGKLIYSPQDKKGKGEQHTFYLRLGFQLKDKPEQAWLQYIADDAAVASINGTPVAQASNWKIAEVVEVASELGKGMNVIGFQYKNTFSAGGVMAELFIRFPDGTIQYIDTDEAFKTSAKAPKGWDTTAFQATDWKPVSTAFGPPTAPWTHRIAYRDFAHPQTFIGAKVTPEHARGGETVRLVFDFSGQCPQTPFKGTIVMRHGRTLLWDEAVSVGDNEIRNTGERTWRITFDYKLPVCLASNQADLYLESNAIFCQAGGLPLARFHLQGQKQIPGCSQALTSRMARTPYGPTLMVNEKPCFPLWGAVAQNRRKDKLPRHGDAPLNVVTVWCDAGKFWPETDRIDTAHFDYQAEKHLRQNPDAMFMWDLSLYPPQDWEHRYPDDMCRDDKGNINRDGGRVNYSFASPQIRKDFHRVLPQLIGYLEKSPYANKIVGYRINSGHTVEWLGWDPKPSRCLDFSPVARKAFECYARKNYPRLKDHAIPSLDSRRARDNGEYLWDPQRHLNAIAYHTFYSDSMADLLIDTCKLARRLVGNRKVIGTYYGYVFTLNSGGSAQMRAHFALKKVLDSGAVDFLMSPQPYSIRQIGDPNGDMKPFASISNHTIMSVIEDDSRTHHAPYQNYSNAYQTVNEDQTIAVIRRNASIAVCRNQPVYFYAICAGTEFDFPAAARDLATMRTVGQHALDHQAVRTAQIAIVVSEKTITAMPMLSGFIPTSLYQQYARDGSVQTGHTGGVVQATESFNFNLKRFSRIGAPVDYLLAEDLKDHAKTYKLYLFVNCFRYDKPFLEAISKLRQQDTTLVWFWAPGYTYGEHNHLDNMKQLTGFTFRKALDPMVPALKMADGRWMGTLTTRIAPLFQAVPVPGCRPLSRYEDGSIGHAAMLTGKARSIFVGTYHVDMPFLMELARNAGVHLYSQTADPMEANSHFVTLHARFPGRKTVRLPQAASVLDVFKRRMIARNTATFSFDAPLHSSWLFYVGPEAEKLLEKLNLNSP